MHATVVDSELNNNNTFQYATKMDDTADAEDEENVSLSGIFVFFAMPFFVIYMNKTKKIRRKLLKFG